MRVTEVKYTRRVNTGNYEHEEFSATAVLEEGESSDHIDAFNTLKADVQQVVSGEANPSGGEAGQEAAGKTGGKKPAKKSKKSKPAPTTTQDDESETEETEDETDADAGGDDSEEETETEETEDETETEEEDETEDPPAKPAAGKKTPSTAGAKGSKGFKKKAQVYQRENAAHKDLFGIVLRKVAPNWKKSFESKAHAKNVSKKLEGKDFLDADGNVLNSFEAEVKKAMGKFGK